VADPGPHLASCRFSDPDYTPPDLVSKVGARTDRALACQVEERFTLGEACAKVAYSLPDPDLN
jgi:hypothetical protein